MKTIAHVNTRRILEGFACSLLVAFAAGCIYVHETTSGYTSDDLQGVADRTLDGQIPADLKSIEIDNRLGALRVVAVEGTTGQWSWKLKVQAKTDELAKQFAEKIECSATRDGDKLRVAVSVPDFSGPRSVQSDLELRVPKSLAIRAHNHFGSTTIAGINGDVEATGQNGSVEVRDIGGSVRVENSFASLKVSDTGPASLKNRNGSIDALRIKGPLEAETSFASLDARDIAGKLTARNQNGRIRAQYVRGPADLQTSFAELSAEDIQGPVTLANRNGSVRIRGIRGEARLKTSFADLSAEDVHGDTILANQNGRISARNISGAVNAATSFASLEIESAGTKLVCRNRNGSIRINARSPELELLDAETSFSSLEVRLPATLKPAIQARTSFGDIESDFPVLMKARGEDAFADVAADVPRVKLNNQNGHIRVVREKAVAER